MKKNIKIKDPRPLRDVATFHETFDLPNLKHPGIPSNDRCRLRMSLLEEELDELREAIKQNDIVEVADAFCDLQYVLSGAILEFGMGTKFKAMFKEVQRSNMSKACKTLEEAEQTMAFYKEHKNTDAHIVNERGLYFVYRKGDGKVLKSVNYSPANLASILKSDMEVEALETK